MNDSLLYIATVKCLHIIEIKSFAFKIPVQCCNKLIVDQAALAIIELILHNNLNVNLLISF